MKNEFEFESQAAYVEYSKKHCHPYSHGVQRLLDMSTDYYQYALDEAKKGRQVYYTQCGADTLPAYSLGAIPIALNELGRIGDYQAISFAENHYLVPKETCAMVEVMLGEFYIHRKDPAKKVLLASTTCEALNMALQLIPKDGYSLHIMQGIFRPNQCDEERLKHKVQFMEEEIRRAMRFVSDGQEIDEKKLEEEIIRNNRIIDKVSKIKELRKEKPRYIKSIATMYLLSGAQHYFGRPEEFEDIVDEITDEMTHENPEFENDTNVIPLTWIGGRSQEFSVYHAIDEAGGAILGWSGGFNDIKFDESLPPLESIVMHSISTATGLPLQGRKQRALEAVEGVNAKGAILYDYVGCSVHNIASEVTRDYLKQNNIPLLNVIGTYQVGKPSGQVLTRVNAFLEMLS